MFRSLSLIDFQSHQSTTLELAPFTVIVGSSSSGKSAVVRALRLVAENARGTSFVRQGAKHTRVTLEVAGSEPVPDASMIVTIDKGKGVSSYTLRLAGMHDDPMIFTKCASSAPDAVTNALELGDSKLWIAGQFDRPFLLDETGSEVARVLGRLTNVDMIYAAVREANRRAAEAKRHFALRSGDLDQARSELVRFASLPARLKAGQEAEAALSRAESVSARVAGLSSLVFAAAESERRSSAARASIRPVPDVSRLTELSLRRRALVQFVPEVQEVQQRIAAVSSGLRSVPNTESFAPLVARRASFKSVLRELSQVGVVVTRLSEQITSARDAADRARSEFAEALASAGSCPLCGAAAAHAQIDHVV